MLSSHTIRWVSVTVTFSENVSKTGTPQLTLVVGSANRTATYALEQNQKYLTMIPEFMKYLYAIMPDRKSMMISVDELSELVENSEIEVAKQLRGQ